MSEGHVADVVGTGDGRLSRPGWRSAVSWGAIFAGFVVAVAVQAVWTALGLAIGLNVLPGASVQTTGIAAGIWMICTAIISLFIGGLVTGRELGPVDRRHGAFHGIVLWGLSTLLVVWLMMRGLGAVTGGAVGLAGNVANGAIAGATQGAAQLGAAATQNPENARRVAQGAENTAHAMRAETGTAAESISTEAGEVVNSATSVASSVAWGMFVALVLTAVAAAAGAGLTARKRIA